MAKVMPRLPTLRKHLQQYEADLAYIETELAEKRREVARLSGKRTRLRKQIADYKDRLDVLSKPENAWMLAPEPTFEDVK